MKHDVIIRPAKESDQGYVASTWIHNQEERADDVDRVLDRKTTRVLIAHPPSNVDRIEGWLCFERIEGWSGFSWQPRALRYFLHMAYVRAELRRGGIGKALVRAMGAGPNAPIVLT